MRNYPILIMDNNILNYDLVFFFFTEIQALVSFTVNLKLDLIKSECEATINADLGLFPAPMCSCNEPDKSPQQHPVIYGTIHIFTLTLNKVLSV